MRVVHKVAFAGAILLLAISMAVTLITVAPPMHPSPTMVLCGDTLTPPHPHA